MQKRWMGTLACLCFASLLFSGCGFNQAQTNQSETNQTPQHQGMSTSINRGANWVDHSGENTAAADRWNRAPYATRGLFRGDRAQAQPSGDILWGNRMNYMMGSQASVLRTTNNSNRDVTDEARGWGNPNYMRYSRVNQPNSNIWGRNRGAAVPEWTPEGRVYQIKKAAPYMERDRNQTNTTGSR